METQYICYQGKDGKPAYRKATAEELAALQPEQIVWHNELKPFRVTVSNDVWKDLFAKKREHVDYLELTGIELYPDLVMLLEVVKTISTTNIINDGVNTFIYLDEVLDIHRPIITKYGASIENKN